MYTFNEFVDTHNININFVECYGMKSLKIPKGTSESYIEEQTTQWPNEKKYKRTNNDQQNIRIYKTKDRVTRTPLLLVHFKIIGIKLLWIKQ